MGFIDSFTCRQTCLLPGKSFPCWDTIAPKARKLKWTCFLPSFSGKGIKFRLTFSPGSALWHHPTQFALVSSALGCKHIQDMYSLNNKPLAFSAFQTFPIPLYVTFLLSGPCQSDRFTNSIHLTYKIELPNSLFLLPKLVYWRDFPAYQHFTPNCFCGSKIFNSYWMTLSWSTGLYYIFQTYWFFARYSGQALPAQKLDLSGKTGERWVPELLWFLSYQYSPDNLENFQQQQGYILDINLAWDWCILM